MRARRQLSAADSVWRVNDRDALEDLWEAHLADSFPASAHEVDDPSPELLDTEIAGIVSTFRGTTDLRADHRTWLRSAIRDLDCLLPQLDSDAVAYFSRLRQLALVVLGNGDEATGPGPGQMDAWLGEVRAVLVDVSDELTVPEAERVERLIEHGEPVEGLLSLAWILDKRETHTSPDTRERIKDLAGDLVEEDFWPSSWQPK